QMDIKRMGNQSTSLREAFCDLGIHPTTPSHLSPAGGEGRNGLAGFLQGFETFNYFVVYYDRMARIALENLGSIFVNPAAYADPFDWHAKARRIREESPI